MTANTNTAGCRAMTTDKAIYDAFENALKLLDAGSIPTAEIEIVSDSEIEMVSGELQNVFASWIHLMEEKYDVLFHDGLQELLTQKG